MTPQQAIIKVRDDIISWCTANFKKKADTTKVTELEAEIGTLETTVKETSFLCDVYSSTGTDGVKIADIEGTRLKDNTGGLIAIYAPTLQEHCSNREKFILVEGVHYGDSTPGSPVNGQLFFLKVDE